MPTFGFDSPSLIRSVWDPQPTQGSTQGGSPYNWDPTYGGVPNLPPYLTDTTTQTGTDVQQQLIQNLPGYLGMSAADSANIQGNLAGQLSPDVIALMQQQAAERGVMTGSPGSPNTNAAYLRALGLTSQQLQQLGSKQLTEAMQRTPVQQKQTTQQQTDLAALRALYAAAPVPANAAAANRAAMNQGLGSGYGAGGGGGNYWQRQADFMRSFMKPEAPVSAGYGGGGGYKPTVNAPAYGQGTAEQWAYDPSLGYYDPMTGDIPMDAYGPPSGGGGGFASWEGTPGMGWANDTYTTPYASYYDPYGTMWGGLQNPGRGLQNPSSGWPGTGDVAATDYYINNYLSNGAYPPDTASFEGMDVYDPMGTANFFGVDSGGY